MNAKSSRLPPERGPRMVDGWYVVDAKFPSDPMARLVYYARLAPSTHNSQPWRFVAGAAEIDLFAELDRWLKVADPDRREMHISLGCAIEALRIAADFAGYGTEVKYFPVERDESLVARVAVAFGGPKRENAAADLVLAMVTRHTSRKPFDPAQAVTDEDKRRLYSCFEIEGVSLHFLQERSSIDALAAAEARADEALLARPGYREELARAVGAGFRGTPWVLSKLGQLAVGHLPVNSSLAREDAARLASAPLVALLTTRNDTRVDQVRAGEAFMRVALVAEKRGIRLQPASQLLEVPQGRADIGKLFELGERVPQHLFRLGHAEAESHGAPRRSLDSVLIKTK